MLKLDILTDLENLQIGLPQVANGKYKKPRASKNLICVPVIYKTQPNVWMNAEIFKHCSFLSLCTKYEKLILEAGSSERYKWPV